MINDSVEFQLLQVMEEDHSVSGVQFCHFPHYEHYFATTGCTAVNIYGICWDAINEEENVELFQCFEDECNDEVIYINIYTYILILA